jgi:hypothetical protein
MRKLKGIFFSLSFLFLFTACREKFSTINECIVAAKDEASTVDTLIIDSAGKFPFSRLNKINNGGLACSFVLEPKYQNKKICVLFSGRCRSNFVQSGATISLSANAEKDNELLSWRAAHLKVHMTDIDQWCSFKDSIVLPPNFNGKVYKTVSVFAFLGGTAGENFDIDTLKVIYKELK